MDILKKFYYDPTHHAGYAGAPNLIHAADKEKIPREDVTNWLRTQDAYTLHRPIRRRFPRRHYAVDNIDDVWEADLVDLRSLKDENDGSVYLLVVIDVLSKYAWVETLRDKTCAETTEGFKRILSRSSGRAPVWLQTDRGKEFVGSVLQRFLKSRGINFRVARNPDIKAAIVERFNRTLKERMWRYFTHKNTRRYVDVLQSIVQAYNDTKHSTIKMQPAAVTLYNAAIARANMVKRYKLCHKVPKYKVGELVRISKAKSAFEKGYEARWSEEIFKIHKIITNRQPPIYELVDLNDEEIDGFFYEEELSVVEKEIDAEEFLIEKIIKTKGKGRNKQYFVSWRGYPEKFNSWIPATDIVNK